MALTDKALSMIGLATKAGKIVSGEFAVTAAVRKHQALLVVVAEDASENTRKSYRDMCTYHHIPLRFYGTLEELGLYTGKGLRASLAVMDAGFANTIEKLIDQRTQM